MPAQPSLARRSRGLAAVIAALSLSAAAVPPDAPTPAPDARATAAAPSAAPLPRRLRVLGINDFHGALEPRADASGTLRGGAAPLAAAIARARAECPAPECVSVLLDGGDELQGTPASNLAFGRPAVQLFGLLGVDAAALGNHEFDFGRDTLRARLRQARYAVLAANVRTAAGARLAGTADDTLIARGALRVGVVGFATPLTPTVTRAANVRGLTFGPMAAAFDARARALRARGAHVVLAVAHSGAFCDAGGRTGCKGEIIDFANAVGERADAIVSGHTHSLVDARVRGTPVVQARSSGRGLAVVALGLDSAPGAPLPDSTRTEVRDVVGAGDDAPAAVRTLVREAVAAVAARVERPVATVAEALATEPDEQYALGNLIADAQRWAARTDFAVMNNGGIRTGLPAGPATYGALFEVQPFGNVLYRVTARGRDIRAYFERLVAREKPRTHVSGVALVYDPSRPPNTRLTDVVLPGGRPLDDGRLYSIAMNDFLATGGEGLGLAGRAASSVPLNVQDLDALIGYLRQLPQPVRAPGEVRIRAAESAQ